MSTAPTNTGTWSTEEHERFLKAMEEFKTWDDVAERVGTRSRKQCVSHDQKLRKKLKRHVDQDGTQVPLPRVEHYVPDDYGSRTRSSSRQAAAEAPETGVAVVSFVAVDLNFVESDQGADQVTRLSDAFDTLLSDDVQDAKQEEDEQQ